MEVTCPHDKGVENHFVFSVEHPLPVKISISGAALTTKERWECSGVGWNLQEPFAHSVRLHPPGRFASRGKER